MIDDKIRFRITFTIFGDSFNVSECTNIVNIEPSSTNIKGEMGKYCAFKETSWDYIIENNNFNLDYLTDEIINLFGEKKSEILKFKNKNDLSIKLFVEYFIYDSIVPSLCINQQFLEFATFLGMEIDIDGFIY